jgi:NADPH-dependent glutamate synthase beta subunit-like oxidoreductase
LAKEKKFSQAVEVLREKLTFPHSLSHVCSHKCELGCKRGRMDEAVAIRELKRFALENDTSSSWRSKTSKLPDSGKRIAIIGAGPCGLTAAWHLARKGHSVKVFERRPNPGGMLRYGIPKHRLDRKIVDAEIETIKSMGVSIETGVDVKSALMAEGFDAALVSVGAQMGSRTHLDVSGCSNVWQAVEFCALAEEEALAPLGAVTVLGGGNVAFDCARIAARMGCKVKVACLEPLNAMLADKEEIDSALSEGAEIAAGFSSTGVLRDGSRITGIEGVSIKSFRFGPKGLEVDEVPGSSRVIETDSLVIATGQRIGLDESFGLKLGRGNSVVVDESMSSSVPGIFAAGDAVTGTLSVVEAIASARKAASSIDLFLGGDGDISEAYYERPVPESRIGQQEFSMASRSACCDDAKSQSQRCLQCDLRLNISKVKMWTDPHFKKKREAAL